MQHPTNLATNAQEQQDQYTYHPVTGALATLTDRRNHYFEFWRNAAGQMTSLRGPQYSDSLRYDLEGRLVKRVEWAAIAGALHDDSIAYDARGKQTYVKVNAAGGRQASQYWQWYSGIGMLVGTDWQNEADNGRAQEAYGTDALGNVVWRRSDDGGGGTAHIRWDQAYDAGLGRLRTIESVNTGYLSGDFYPEKTTRSYDLAGNTDWTVLSQMGDIGAGNIDVVRDKRSRSYYGADQRLRYFQERDVRRADGMGGGTPELEGVWEEYRYDPLGRRVLVNTRTKDLCTTGTAFRCASATTRMVWAGDQLLWEIRRSSESPGETSTSAGSYGTVSYTHAGGIDRPLVITKGSTSILPHQNWRGQFSSGTYANGARSDCAPGVTTNCHAVNWPGYRTTAWHHDAKEPNIRAWWGGLVDGMRDASGQQYMRNRYYDPATGQFTQPDPIGIAGGLNSYGFAAGDPVTYSDPYGLCAQSGGDTTKIQACTVEQDRQAAWQGTIRRESTDAAVPWYSDPIFHGVSFAAGGLRAGGGLLAAGAERAAVRGIAALASRAGNPLAQIQRAGQIVGRLGLSQSTAASLITKSIGRMGYQIGDDVMIGSTRYLVSQVSDDAIAIGANGRVSNAVVREVRAGVYELVR
jgi:RHS repeat-associated protein